jgi:hypothetical protein
MHLPSPPRTAVSPDAGQRALPPVRGLVLLVASAVLAGVPLGLLWSWVAPAVPVRVTATGPAFVTQQPEQVAAADAWFALLGLAAGVLVAAVAWRVAPRLRGPAGLLALTAGLIGAALLAWWTGRQVGLAGYQAALESAAPGTVLDRPVDLRVARAGWWPLAGVPLVPALSAAVTYTLLAAWSRFADLRPDRVEVSGGHPGPDPGPWPVEAAEPERP